MFNRVFRLDGGLMGFFCCLILLTNAIPIDIPRCIHVMPIERYCHEVCHARDRVLREYWIESRKIAVAACSLNGGTLTP